MPKYLGQVSVDIKDTPFAHYNNIDWAMHFNKAFGSIDGDHHKTWVLDQMSRILKGTPVIVELASWDDGQKEYRYWTGEPTKEYQEWVVSCRGLYDEDEECYEYDYDEGIAP